MGSQGEDSERSFEERESAHLQNVIENLRKSMEHQSIEHQREKETLLGEN